MRSLPRCSVGLSALLAFLLLSTAASSARCDPGDVRGAVPLDFTGSVDIAFDSSDGTYWIVSWFESQLRHFSADLREQLGVVPIPLPLLETRDPCCFVTGLTYNSNDDTLLVSDNFAHLVIEYDKRGELTGREIFIPRPPVEIGGVETLLYSVTGLTFDPAGDGGRGSVYAILTGWQLSIIYELGLDDRVIRVFPPETDPDRFLGLPGTGFGLHGGITGIHRDDELVGFYVTAHAAGDQAILKLDRQGEYLGTSISLDAVGGNVTGLLRQSFPHPETGALEDSYVCVSNLLEVTILEGGEPSLRRLSNIACHEEGEEAVISWTRGQIYDRIEILADGLVVDTLEGGADSWRGVVSPGLREMEVRAVEGLESDVLGPCAILLGYGQILGSAVIDEETAFSDITSDREGELILCGFDARELVFMDLALEVTRRVPLAEAFASEGDLLTGVAGGEERDTVLVYNATQGTLGKIDFFGDLMEQSSIIFPEGGWIEGMTYSRLAGEDVGTIWGVDRFNERIHGFDLFGELRSSRPHPLSVIDGAEAPCRGGFTSGIASIPGRPELFIGGRTSSRRWPVSLFRVGTETLAIQPGNEIPLDVFLRDRFGPFPAIEYVETPDGPILYVLNRFSSRVYRLDAAPPVVLPPAFPECRQVDREGRVELGFESVEAYETIEIFRDDELLVVIPGEARSFVDESADPGIRRYAIRGAVGNARSDFARCELRVGLGAVLDRLPVCPVDLPIQMDVDPVDGSIWVLERYSHTLRFGRIHHYDENLELIETVLTETELPFALSSFAVRVDDAGERTLNYTTFRPEVSPREGEQPVFFISQPPGGAPSEPIRIFPPERPGLFIRPLGLVWDRTTDTFFYQEINSNTFVQMDLDGTTIRTFPNPAPAAHFAAQDHGLTISPGGGTLFFSTADDGFEQVTKAVEMRRDGTLTGFELPLPFGPKRGHEVRDIHFAGPDLVLVGPFVEGGAFMRLKVFDDEPGVEGSFVRGDANRDGEVNLSDAIHLLGFLFLGEVLGDCRDAADADDDGVLNLTDSVYVLNFLFVGGPQPPAPFPAPGLDPSDDVLSCPIAL